MSAEGRQEERVTAPRRPAHARGWAVGALVAGALLTSLLVRQELRSIERGNRLYRAGDTPAAADVYAQALGATGDEQTTYNLGTALLWLDADSAEALLSRTTQVEDPDTRQRGFYNLGYAHLVDADASSLPDTVIAALRSAVVSYRTALRLDPTDQNARWNLALAVRRLDALMPPGGDEGEESGSESEDEIPMNDPSLARSETATAESGPEPEDPNPADNIGERRGPREGAQEAWAMQDPGPLTLNEALALLATVSDDAELLVKGTLWSRRPDVAWWSGQPYPGGLW
jgi:hypothetical protein